MGPNPGAQLENDAIVGSDWSSFAFDDGALTGSTTKFLFQFRLLWHLAAASQDRFTNSSGMSDGRFYSAIWIVSGHGGRAVPRGSGEGTVV